MMSALGVTLLVGVGVGVLVGVPLGRFLERVRPTKKKKKPKDDA